LETFSIPTANKILHVIVLLLIYYIDQFVASDYQKLVTADVIAVFVNKQHDIQRRSQNFDKKFVFN